MKIYTGCRFVFQSQNLALVLKNFKLLRVLMLTWSLKLKFLCTFKEKKRNSYLINNLYILERVWWKNMRFCFIFSHSIAVYCFKHKHNLIFKSKEAKCFKSINEIKDSRKCMVVLKFLENIEGAVALHWS